MNVKQINTTALAYMGDAVYETLVRQYLIETGQTNADKLHKLAVRFVRAEGQALAFEETEDALTPEEQALARRARNRKITSCPKNIEPMTYKKATAFEALVGYLYLRDEEERLKWLVQYAIKTINEKGKIHDKR